MRLRCTSGSFMAKEIVPNIESILIELRSIDILSIISSLAPILQLSEKGLWETQCPACDDKLLINVCKNIMHCFHCCFAGDITSYVVLKEGMSFNEALKYIQDKGIKKCSS